MATTATGTKKNIKKTTSDAAATASHATAAANVKTTNDKNIKAPTPHIFFGVFDGKVDKQGKIKFFEFGLGPTSMLRDPVASFNTVSRIIQTETNLPVYSIEELLSTQIACLKASIKPQTVFADYRCVQEPQHGIIQGHLQNTSVLMLNNLPAWSMVALNKVFMHEMFEQAKLQDARPKAKVCPLDYTKELMQEIKKHFQVNTETFVIKAAISSHGRGVFVVKAAELDITLQLLLGLCKADEKKQAAAIETYKAAFAKQKSTSELGINIDKARQWAYEATKHSKFMIEKFCVAEPVLINTKKFDATLRSEFLIIMDANSLKFHLINCYWDCPQHPINEGEVSEQVAAAKDMSKDTHEVNESIRELIVPQLNAILPGFFRFLVGFDMIKYFQSYDLNDPNEAIAKALLLYAYVKILNTLSQYIEIINIFSPSNPAHLGDLINVLNGRPHPLMILREIAEAFFYSTFNPYLSERKMIVNHVGAYRNLSHLMLLLENPKSEKEWIDYLAELYLQLSVFLKHALDIPAVAAAAEFADSGITQKDVADYHKRAHSLQRKFLLQNPSSSPFLPAREKVINQMIASKKILLTRLKMAKDNLSFLKADKQIPLIFGGINAINGFTLINSAQPGVIVTNADKQVAGLSKLNSNATATAATTSKQTPNPICPRSHEALLKDWNEWAAKNNFDDINITKNLVKKLLEELDYNRALRLIAGSKNHQFAYEAAKQLLKYKTELSIDIQELPDAIDSTLRRSALHLAAAGGHEKLYVEFTEVHKANAELLDGAGKKASDLMLEHVIANMKRLTKQNLFLI